MSRLRQNPKFLVEGVFIFDVEASFEGLKKPRLAFRYPPPLDVSERGDAIKIVDVAKFCLPFAQSTASDSGTQSRLPKSILMEQTFTFTFTDEEGYLQFGFCHHTDATVNHSNETGRALKKHCAVLISHYPWNKFFCGLVQDLLRINREMLPHFLERLAERDNECRFGQMRKKSIRIEIEASGASSRTISLTVPDDSALPALASQDHVVYDVFDRLGAENVVKAACAVLMERRIIVVSDTLSHVTQCIHILDNLLFPMSWQHTFIPVLPSHVKEVVCAMMPYLIGVHSSVFPMVLDLLAEDESDGYVLVDCDKNEVISPYHDEKRIPHDWYKTLISTYVPVDKRKEKAARKIAEGFVTFFVSTIGHYHQYLAKDPTTLEFHLIEERFLKAAPVQHQPFLVDLMETQHFCQFISQRCDARATGTEVVHLFDQIIARPYASAENVKETIFTPQRASSTRLRTPTQSGRRLVRPFSKWFSRSSEKRSKSPNGRRSAVDAASNMALPQQFRTLTSYHDFLREVVQDMEQTGRGLDMSLAMQNSRTLTLTNDLDVAVALLHRIQSEHTTRYMAIIDGERSEKLKDAEAFREARAKNAKTQKQLKLCSTLLQEATELGNTVSTIADHHEHINGAALSGVANFKQYWVQAQMGMTDIDPEHAPSDKVIEQLSWLLSEAENVGSSHYTANDRRELCIKDAVRMLQKIEASEVSSTLLQNGTARAAPQVRAVDDSPAAQPSTEYSHRSGGVPAAVALSPHVKSAQAQAGLQQAVSDGDTVRARVLQRTDTSVISAAMPAVASGGDHGVPSVLYTITICTSHSQGAASPCVRMVLKSSTDETKEIELPTRSNNELYSRLFSAGGNDTFVVTMPYVSDINAISVSVEPVPVPGAAPAPVRNASQPPGHDDDDVIIYAELELESRGERDTEAHARARADTGEHVTYASIASLEEDTSTDDWSDRDRNTDAAFEWGLESIAIAVETTRVQFACNHRFSAECGLVHTFHTFANQRRRSMRRGHHRQGMRTRTTTISHDGHATGELTDTIADVHSSVLTAAAGFRAAGADSPRKKPSTRQRSSRALRSNIQWSASLPEKSEIGTRLRTSSIGARSSSVNSAVQGGVSPASTVAACSATPPHMTKPPESTLLPVSVEYQTPRRRHSKSTFEPSEGTLFESATTAPSAPTVSPHTPDGPHRPREPATPVIFTARTDRDIQLRIHTLAQCGKLTARQIFILLEREYGHGSLLKEQYGTLIQEQCDIHNSVKIFPLNFKTRTALLDYTISRTIELVEDAKKTTGKPVTYRSLKTQLRGEVGDAAYDSAKASVQALLKTDNNVSARNRDSLAFPDRGGATV
eukprot:m.1158491 g.1158491  ORF g.1158491 m.1158491 type:complete len:1341 (+) comp24500_c0_seq13:174-4196(+)